MPNAVSKRRTQIWSVRKYRSAAARTVVRYNTITSYCLFSVRVTVVTFVLHGLKWHGFSLHCILVSDHIGIRDVSTLEAKSLTYVIITFVKV
jgi:hypothetical protein